MDGDRYAAAWTMADGTEIGTRDVAAGEVHTVARQIVNENGGTVRVLRAVEDGWREVARYSGGEPALVAVGR